MTQAQSVSRATPPITGEFVESLRVWHSGSADQIGQTRLPLSFGFANVVQSVGNHNSYVDASDLTTNVVHTFASKVLYTPLFTAMEWSSSSI